MQEVVVVHAHRHSFYCASLRLNSTSDGTTAQSAPGPVLWWVDGSDSLGRRDSTSTLRTAPSRRAHRPSRGLRRRRCLWRFTSPLAGTDFRADDKINATLTPNDASKREDLTRNIRAPCLPPGPRGSQPQT